MNKTPYETMQELTVLIGEINDKRGAVNKCRGMNPEDVPPEFYREFVAAKLVDAGYRKGREGKWIRKRGLPYCSECDTLAMLKADSGGWKNYHESEFCPYCGAKMEARTC